MAHLNNPTSREALTGASLISPLLSRANAMPTELLSWRIDALVLLLDIRTCANCNSSVSAPNPHLMVREHNPNTRLRLQRLTRYDFSQHIAYSLPREVQRIYTSVDRCPSCFLTSSPYGQLELFPAPLPQTSTRTLSEPTLEKEDSSHDFTPLSDF